MKDDFSKYFSSFKPAFLKCGFLAVRVVYFFLKTSTFVVQISVSVFLIYIFKSLCNNIQFLYYLSQPSFLYCSSKAIHCIIYRVTCFILASSFKVFPFLADCPSAVYCKSKVLILEFYFYNQCTMNAVFFLYNQTQSLLFLFFSTDFFGMLHNSSELLPARSNYESVKHHAFANKCKQ